MNGFRSKIIMYHNTYGSAQRYDNYLGIDIKFTRFFFSSGIKNGKHFD